MRLFFIILILNAYTCIAQDKNAIVVNKLNQDTGQLTNKIFKYHTYTDGKVIFKDNAGAEAKMNYNKLSGKMLFITPKSDTLVLARPETFEMIAVGVDTFYFADNNYVEKITHYTTENIGVNQRVKLIGKEKKGAYGTYSGVSSANSNTTFTNDDQITAYLNVDENIVFKLTNVYYISDKFNNFFPANKKNFYKIFFAREKEIKDFLAAHTINFNKIGDLEKLLRYIQDLN